MNNARHDAMTPEAPAVLELSDVALEFLEEGALAGEKLLLVLSRRPPTSARPGDQTPEAITRALEDGHAQVIDARAVLTCASSGGTIHAEAFRKSMADLLERLGGDRVRVYDESVELMRRDGLLKNAQRLQVLWSTLAHGTSRTITVMHAVGQVSSSETSSSFSKGQRNSDAGIFRVMIEAVRDHAIFLLTPTGHVSTWNLGAERIKGYTAEEIVGHHFSRFYEEADVRAGKCETALRGAEQEGRFESEGWRLRRDGSRFWANVVITAIHGDDGALIGFTKVTRDLTERRAAEEARLHLVKEQEVNRSRDEFLATISHELRTPLNAILGWAVLLEGSPLGPNDLKAVRTIVKNAKAQANIIDDLLDVSRIITGKLHVELDLQDFVVIVREAIEVVRPAVNAKGIRLETRGLEGPITILGDAARLQQVVWNLLTNAVKFSAQGATLSVVLEADERDVRLRVTDTGRGIDPAFVPYVFDRFRQADSSTTRRTGGLGLGLSIVKQLVEHHGGTVDARSEGLGKGSTFEVVLPRAEPPREA